MGFHAGNYSIPALIAEMVAELAATPDWTVWDANTPGGYCLLYVPDETYLTIQVRYDKYTRIGATAYYWTGIAFRFSSMYNLDTHEPTGSIDNGFVPLYWHSNSSGYLPVMVDTDHQYPVMYWVDKYGIQAVIQNPFRTSVSDLGAFFTLEAIPAAKREFSDGYRALCFHCRSSNGLTWDDQATVADQNYYFLNVRPFHTKQMGSLVNYHTQQDAYRSLGNSKIYFEFPYFHNETMDFNPDVQRDYLTPIYQTRRWFVVSPAGGLAVNDIVSWLDPDGVTVRKFIVGDFRGETDPNLLVAIPYDHAYEY